MEEQTYTLEQIKKYLAYVRQEIHPTLTRQACEVIKGFYLILRENCPGNAFQITNRQL
jgi:DNA replicative helicase MCM subunit Mcm2 (Cdc46/Mcm family)